ncbi:hypothetical protein [Methanosarcina sp. UBA5]|uniref:hypothetical protein n=1 Tax=Methanosarcina sp. UBA5 TaxID=1915593 RepID=UPI0025F3037C|nr:hypothetical protein [Methanosarcina sp. UBA5]
MTTFADKEKKNAKRVCFGLPIGVILLYIASSKLLDKASVNAILGFTGIYLAFIGFLTALGLLFKEYNGKSLPFGANVKHYRCPYCHIELRTNQIMIGEDFRCPQCYKVIKGTR